MDTIHAIFEDGVFRPVTPVALPDKTEVEFEPRLVESEPCGTESDNGLDEIYAILSKRFNSGDSDVAARHNEHQP
jgi:predicted DNA-binding antitoxin AbrB/MazE fold protein